MNDYRWILIFDWFKKMTVPEIFEKLKGEISIRTLYNWHNRYVKEYPQALKLAGELKEKGK